MINQIEKGMFVVFYTDVIERIGYGKKDYFSRHLQLPNQLIEEFLKRIISIISVDFVGVRKYDCFYCTYISNELYKYDRIALQSYCGNKFLVDSPLGG